MKKIIVAINLVWLLSAAGFAQKNKNGSPPIDRVNSLNRKPKLSKNKNIGKNGGITLQTEARLEGGLQKTLDVKYDSVGDENILKVIRSIMQNGETIVPKGARLIGKVTEVQQKTKDNGTSKIGVAFERIQAKNLDLPINASIVSLTQAATNPNLGGGLDSDVSGSSNSSTRTSSANSGGGVLGGVGSGAVSAATNTLGSIIKGISLSQSADVSAQSSTTPSAQGKPGRVEKGVVFGIRLSESV